MKQLFSILLFLLVFSFQPLTAKFTYHETARGEDRESIHLEIQERANEIFDSLVLVRRDLHRFPELSGQEKRTSEKIAEYLSSIGLEVKTNIGGFGVVGILRGAQEGKKLAWRADIDAMPSKAHDAVDFRSKNEGVRHICGHDVHTTVALGIANVLAGQKENLAGTIYFVFQPSEENLKGAKAMLDDGLFDIIDPEEMYALHITPFPAGTIATKSAEMFADLKRLKVTFKKSGNNDAHIDFAKEQILKLQNIEPESKFWDMMNMGDPKIGIAGLNSIYRDYTIINGAIKAEESKYNIELSAFIRTSDKKQQDLVVPFLEKQFSNSEYSDELIKIDYLPETPTIFNDNKLTGENLRF